MRAFIGSYAAHGLAVLDDLTITARIAVPNASWLAFSADGRHLYAVNEQPAGTVTTVDTETLAILGQQPTGGDTPTHLDVHGDHLLVANYGSGSVAVLPSTDLVTFPEGSHAHQVVTDPTGRWILAVDIGGNAVHVYELDGKLRERQRVTVPGGPRHLVFHPDGRHVYVVCEYESQVVVGRWSDGELTVGHAVPTVAPGVSNYPGEGVVSPDGRFLYVTNRGENSIATFTLHDGEPILPRTTPTGGEWPRHATLDPTGRHLFVANQRSGTVTWLPRDPDTGALSTMAGSVSVPFVAMVVFA